MNRRPNAALSRVLPVVEAALQTTITSMSAVSGGDINLAFRLELATGKSAFLKTHPNAPKNMFTAEAQGLSWLEETGALPVPQVLAMAPHRADVPGFLVLEYLQSTGPKESFDETLGRGIAALHRFGAPCFGLQIDNFIGSLPQSNSTHASWASFYQHERLLPQVRMTAASGLADSALLRRFDNLFARLPELVGADEPPARLHGDLWGGNVYEAGGLPYLIDPAVYGGYREMDLAMMALFGGFSARVWSAYQECYPLQPNHNERLALYQLYPLLVHLNLFGGNYLGSVRSALSKYVSNYV